MEKNAVGLNDFGKLCSYSALEIRRACADVSNLTRIKSEKSLLGYEFFNAKVVLNDKTTIIYEAHDWNWIDEKILNEADFYFKRSYDEKLISQLKDEVKVFPLRLNYQAAGDKRDEFQMRRAALYASKDKI